MKRVFAAALAALLFSATSALANGSAVNAAFDQEVARLGEQLDRGEITPSVFAEKEESLAHTFFPEDKRAHEFFAYKREIIGKRERNEISREQAIAAIATKHDSLFAEKTAPVSGVFSSGQAPAGPSAAGRFAATFAGALGAALTRNAQQVAPRPPATCTSSAIGGGVSTTCY